MRKKTQLNVLRKRLHRLSPEMRALAEQVLDTAENDPAVRAWDTGNAGGWRTRREREGLTHPIPPGFTLGDSDPGVHHAHARADGARTPQISEPPEPAMPDLSDMETGSDTPPGVSGSAGLPNNQADEQTPTGEGSCTG